MNSCSMVVAAALAGLFFALPVHAQKGDERLREQLRSTITQMRALADENASLKSQLAQTTPAAPGDPEKVTRLQRDLAKLRAERDQFQQSLIEAQQKMSAQNAALEDQKGATIDQQREKLGVLQQLVSVQRSVQLGGQALEQCTADNRTLVSISNELITRYQERGLIDVLASREPITGLRGAQLERLAQSYQIRVGEETVRPAPPAEEKAAESGSGTAPASVPGTAPAK